MDGRLLKLTKELIKWHLAETLQLSGTGAATHLYVAAQTLWQKFTSEDASQLKALFPWQAPYSPSCSLIYELSAGGLRHQRLSLCTPNPHLLYRSVGLSGANRRLLSRHRWLAMDHSQCDVCNYGMPDGQVFHWDTPVNMPGR